MKNQYHLNITIYNNHGDLLIKELSYDTLEEMQLALESGAYAMIEEAKSYGKENLMLYDELYDSKEDADLDIEDYYDGSSRIDLINSDEKFQ